MAWRSRVLALPTTDICETFILKWSEKYELENFVFRRAESISEWVNERFYKKKSVGRFAYVR